MLMRKKKKAETAIHGCHCPDDMAVRMRKVLARPWIDVRVCHLLLLFFSICNRIFEKLMYSRLTKFAKDYNILYDQQYGFRSKHSIQHAILDNVNTILQNMDNG